jgi:hypothetical protein
VNKEMAAMPSSPQSQAPWPRWVIVLASAPIVFHLGCVILQTLAAPSGPWATPDGAGMAIPPPALALLNESVALHYLQGVGLTHNYHFPTNRVGSPDAYLEIHLEDDAGKPLKTVRFPDPDAPPLVRQRQHQLIRWLVEDQPIAPPRGERIYPPGLIPPRVPFWDMLDARRLELRVDLPETEIPRNRMVFRPTRWSMVVIRSIARHECRIHGAAHARVIRYSREVTSPEALVNPQAIPSAIEDLVSDYGKVTDPRRVTE